MLPLGSRLRPASGALGLVLLLPVALFISASLLKYAAGSPALYENLGFLADPQQLPWYERLSPFLFLGGPVLAAVLSLGAVIQLEVRREEDQVVTTVRLTPSPFYLSVAALSLVLLAILAGYVVAANLGST